MNLLRRRRKLDPWPRPEDSIERLIDTRTKTMSRSLAWVPKGPALEMYETKIRADLEAVLANIELPEGAPLFLKLYMIGPDGSSANPMIMVCCVHRKIRKEAELSIRESRVLDRFPGFGLGSSALLLESHGLEELLTIGYQHESDKSESNQDLDESGSTLQIYGSLPHRLGGPIKFVSISKGKVSAVHTTTGGLIIQLDTELYQITAGHGMHFDTPDARVHYSTSELDECEFDGQSDEDDDVTTSRGSSTPEDLSTHSSDEDSWSSYLLEEEAKADQQRKKRPVVHLSNQKIELEAGLSQSDQQKPAAVAAYIKTEPDGNFPPSNVGTESLTGDYERMHLQFHNLDLDYVLLKLPTQSGLSGSSTALNFARQESNTVTKASHLSADNTRVLVMSPDGPITGMISTEKTSYKMRGFRKLQRLLTVKLDGIFLKGYSGSTVMDFDTGAVYGQIILGSSGQSQAYCVSTPSIFADIFSRLGHVPVLDERQWQVSRQHAAYTTTAPLNTITGGVKASKTVINPSTDMNLQSASDTGGSSALTSLKQRSSRSEAADSARRTVSACAQRNTMNTGGIHQLQKSGRKDNEEERPLEQIPKPNSGQSSCLFACPFYLHNRHRWHNCLRNPTLIRIVDVRLHLTRAHALVSQIPMRSEEFREDPAERGSADDRFNAHVQLQTCQPLPNPPPSRDGLTRDQFEAVRTVSGRRNGKRTTDPAAEKWFEIWDILFPDQPRPLSPYIDDHPDAQRIRDMNNETLAGEQWRALTATTRGSSPSLQNTSWNTIRTILERLLPFYRMYQDPDQAAAHTSVTSSLDDSQQQPRNWELMTVPGQPAQATEDPLPSDHPAPAATGHGHGTLQQTRGHPSTEGRPHRIIMTQANQPPSTLANDFDFDFPGFFMDATLSDRIYGFSDVNDPLEAPSQDFTNDSGTNSSGLWGQQGRDTTDQA